MTEAPSATTGEATITRVFDAPRELVHLPAEQYPQAEEGVSGFYDRLAEHLARC